MRIFEIALLFITTILPFYISSKSYRLNKKIPFSIFAFIFLLHFSMEGYRWQMIPAYIIILILIWCLYKNYKFFVGRWFRKTISAIGLLFLLVIGWSLPTILPVFKLPEPSGNYAVGSQYLHLKTNQEEIITSELDDKRELMIKVWFPSIIDTEEKENYLNDGDRMGFATKYGLPSSTFNYLDYVNTHTYINPSVAIGKFPVLIFSHGSYSNASGYYALFEEIVSHGYIVLNINHTYESTGALFPNGDIRLYNTEYDREYNNQEMAEMVWNASQAYQKATTPAAQYTAVEHLIRNYIAVEITTRWSSDISAVIDELEKWNTTTFLTNHIDTTKIGVFGHSQGGSAAGEALLLDHRIKAGINIDGVQWGRMIDSTMTKPFALLSSDWDANHPNFNEHIYGNGSTSDFYICKILNSGHSNFMDIPLMINMPVLNEAGSIQPTKGFKITSTLILNFFDKYLMNESIDLLELRYEHPELKIEIHEKSNTK